MAFLDYYSQLLGSIPELGPEHSKKLINRAWHDIRMFRPWSFLLADTVLQCPSIITAGTASVIQYSNLVTMDATGSAAITGFCAEAAGPPAPASSFTYPLVPHPEFPS